MAKQVSSYVDNKGEVHDTPEKAVIADIARILGRLSADAGIAGGVASLIFEKRSEIGAAFNEYEQLVKPAKAYAYRQMRT